MNIVSITHALFFQNKKFEEAGQHVVAQEKINVCETMGNKTNVS